MSQQMIINMAMVFGIVQVANKFQLDAPENEFYVRLAYGSVQVIGLLLVGYIAWTINSKNDKTEFIYNETKNPFDKK
ncbi:hypothetical protein EDD86DRAFT_204294 [Gorgonomyces haynaldii]|nr:hypothetical protein EDD86DRAFT_204294 [Gorgonomyces haynaldii]